MHLPPAGEQTLGYASGKDVLLDHNIGAMLKDDPSFYKNQRPITLQPSRRHVGRGRGSLAGLAIGLEAEACRPQERASSLFRKIR